MPYDVRIEHAVSRQLAVVRRQAGARELARVVPEGCGIVWSAIRAQNIRGGRHIALYWDDKITLDVGVELDGTFSGHGEVAASATPAGHVATTTHFGPYGGLHAAHEAIRRWCASHGHACAGPSWEIYDHWRDEWNSDPALIRTDVFYLITADARAIG